MRMRSPPLSQRDQLLPSPPFPCGHPEEAPSSSRQLVFLWSDLSPVVQMGTGAHTPHKAPGPPCPLQKEERPCWFLAEGAKGRATAFCWGSFRIEASYLPHFESCLPIPCPLDGQHPSCGATLESCLPSPGSLAVPGGRMQSAEQNVRSEGWKADQVLENRRLDTQVAVLGYWWASTMCINLPLLARTRDGGNLWGGGQACLFERLPGSVSLAFCHGDSCLSA